MDFVDDPEAVKRMIEEEWSPEELRLTGFKSIEDLAEFELFLVKTHGVVMGCCAIRIHDNGAAQLAVYLRREFRGAGVGCALVDSIHNVVNSLGANYVFSFVHEDNKVMHKLLDKFGHEVYPSEIDGFVIRGMEI